jgi:hypothetical protein
LKGIKKYLFACLLLFHCFVSAAQKEIRTDVLVIGGGTSGIAAGIQAARMKVHTIITEPSSWLGGMITAAGVSAFDGNHSMPSGIWAEFREQLYKVYGGASKVATGWVSNTLFEPHVGDSILKAMAAQLPFLKICYQFRFQSAIMRDNQCLGAAFIDADGKRIDIYAKQVIDATELGDVMADAKIPFDLGMEASSRTGEKVNVKADNNIIQDLTYVAILKDYEVKADCTIVKPSGYDPMEFDGCCNEFCSDPKKLTVNVSAKKMLDYGKLPHGKYMINWPGMGNDIYLNLVNMPQDQREEEWKKAKAKTLRFLYFLQAQLGFKNLGLADDEYPTADRLPFIPYNREGRRVQGIIRYHIYNISDPFNEEQPYYRTGIAVGDYPIDHHHHQNPDAPEDIRFYPVPSYSIPLGALIPKTYDGIIIAEKGISTSNVVNGTTRLQPVVMLTGQAAGVLAALAVRTDQQPRKISIRSVQQALLNAKAYIMPYYDVKPTDPRFNSIQKIGATGILRGKGEPVSWANRTWFFPDSTIDADLFIKDLGPYAVIEGKYKGLLTWKDAIEIIYKAALQNKKETNVRTIDRSFQLAKKKISGKADQPVSRGELAIILDELLKPFESKEPDHQGHLH